MKTKVKAISLVLLVLLTVVSCGKEATDTETTAAPDSDVPLPAETEEKTEEETKAHDDLEQTDMGGETFHILIRQERAYEFNTEQTGEIVSDAVFKRNISIEDRFNCVCQPFCAEKGLEKVHNQVSGTVDDEGREIA